MGKIAFLFSGQGAQYPGMGQELSQVSPAAAAVFALADGIRPGTSEQCFNGTKEELTITSNTQPDMFAVELAAAAALTEALLRSRERETELNDTRDAGLKRREETEQPDPEKALPLRRSPRSWRISKMTKSPWRV